MKRAAIGLTTLGATVGSYTLLDREKKRKIEDAIDWSVFCVDSLCRMARFNSTLALIISDYYYHLNYVDKQNRNDINHLLKQIKETTELKDKLKYSSNWEKYINKKQNEEEKQYERNKLIKECTQNIDEYLSKLNHIYSINAMNFHQIHSRNAYRLFKVCEKNGGLFIKLGQMIVMMDYLVPEEYQTTLSPLLNKTPTTNTYETINKIFYKDFKVNISDVFSKFDYTPIASASLSSVYIGEIDSKKYAIKIHHKNLREKIQFDQILINMAIKIIAKIFPNFNYLWLVDEMNLNIPLEIDFLKEKEHMEKARKDLNEFIKSGDLVIPEVLNKYSSSRVLTMSFEEGVTINNNKEILDLNINLKNLIILINKIFSHQIFYSGFVHCDPHYGNILIRKSKETNKAQVVLLDHGLYRKLDTNFQIYYTKLWLAIIKRDEESIKRYCSYMNAGELYPLLAAMMTMSPWDNIIDGKKENSEGGGSISSLVNIFSSIDKKNIKEKLKSESENDEHATKKEKILIQSYARQYMYEINNLLGCIPSDLLLLFKTNDCLRTIEKLLTRLETVQKMKYEGDLNELLSQLTHASAGQSFGYNTLSNVSTCVQISYILNKVLTTDLNEIYFKYKNRINYLDKFSCQANSKEIINLLQNNKKLPYSLSYSDTNLTTLTSHLTSDSSTSTSSSKHKTSDSHDLELYNYSTREAITDTFSTLYNYVDVSFRVAVVSAISYTYSWYYWFYSPEESKKK